MKYALRHIWDDDDGDIQDDFTGSLFEANSIEEAVREKNRIEGLYVEEETADKGSFIVHEATAEEIKEYERNFSCLVSFLEPRLH